MFLAEYRLPYPHITAANTSHRYLSNQCLGGVYIHIWNMMKSDSHNIEIKTGGFFSLSRQNRKYTHTHTHTHKKGFILGMRSLY